VSSPQQRLISKDLSQISWAHSRQEPGIQLLPKKESKEELRNETQIASDGIAHHYKVRETDTASKVSKLRTLWGKPEYLMRPLKKRMVLAITTTLKYLSPIYSNINTDFRFRFYD
jgi:hypothetical protein